MYILKEGEQGKAVCSSCERRVDITYRYRSVRLEQTGTMIENVLAGVCDACGEIALLPAQSVPRLKEAREAKLQTINARIPAHLEDVLHVVAGRYGAATASFTSALLRYYLREVATNEPFARRVRRLAEVEMASGRANARLSLRLSERLWTRAWEEAREAGIQRQTDMLKGLIIAALQDSAGRRAPARKRILEGIAAVS